MNLYSELIKRVEYAKNSKSRELLYEVHGAIGIARKLGAITHDEYMHLEHEAVAKGINNPAVWRD